MLRWLFRLGFVGALVAGAIWLWSQLNQDIEDEELEDEIPIEFEVQMEPDEAVAVLSAEAGDTGVGPGADFTAAMTESTEEREESVGIESTASSDEMAAAVTSESSATTEVAEPNDAQSDDTAQANTLSDLQEIIGIGPVYEGRLLNAGITSIADLATRNPDVLLQIGFSIALADDWLHQAQQRTAEASE